MAEKDNRSIFTEWLEKLQQESWQLELLISGLALFGIYASQDWINELYIYTSTNSEGLARSVSFFFIKIIKVGWRIFFINLLIHVILRGLWIGAIGLRYVSNDIDYKSLNYSEYFTELLQNRVGDFDSFIERLEKICSILFAYTFLLFLLFFSIAIFFLQLFLAFELIERIGSNHALFLVLIPLLYLFVGMIVFIDFITLGIFKKINDRSVNRWYSYIFTFYGYTTLTFLYRPILYNFLDNRYTKRLFFLSIPYILIIMTSSSFFTNNNFSFFPPEDDALRFGYTIDRMHYEDLRQQFMGEVISSGEIRRQIIPGLVLNKYMNDEDYLGLFLKMDPADYILFQNNSDIEPYWKAGLNISLFSDNLNEDTYYEEKREEKREKTDSLRTYKRKLQKKLREEEKEALKTTIELEMDSINKHIEAINKEFSNQAQKFEDIKQGKILASFIDQVDLEIDGIDIRANLDCYFYRHQNNNEKGIMCFYPMDSLAYGKHQLHYYKVQQTSRRNNKRDPINLTIPFYKVQANNSKH